MNSKNKLSLKEMKINKMQKIEQLEEIILELEQWEEGMSLNENTSKQIGPVHSVEQKNTLINFIKENIQLMKVNEPDDNKLYLTEIIKKEKPIFETNNLILSPVGSGKTTLIESVLIKDQTGKILMLVSNTTLKNAVCPDNDDLRKEKGHRMYTTQNKRKYGEERYEIHVMSYSEFGNKVKTNNDFAEEFNQIYCDEIHSLPDYQQYNDSVSLSHAIKYLFDKHENQQIFYFTATNENLINLERRQPGILRNVKTFDYLEHPEIKQYMALSEYKINHIEQIRPHLKARLKSFNYFGYKALAFNKTISGMKTIEKIAIEEGYRPICLWSVNNNDDEFKMSDEQLKVRDCLINNGFLPKPYNFLIINSAMQEGWNLKDDLTKLAIMNTINETERTQALGRHRNDIDILVYRIDKKEKFDIAIELNDKWLNIPMSTEMKSDLCNELKIIDSKGQIRKWPSVSRILKKQGYKIFNTNEIIDGKRKRLSVITKE